MVARAEISGGPALVACRAPGRSPPIPSGRDRVEGAVYELIARNRRASWLLLLASFVLLVIVAT
ncbi:MAG TPA: hypothetical protein VK866_17240, partial [Acidimicrobiales bacterium]|nr:hypothetical protein [Acidimicrobiales bacterium]